MTPIVDLKILKTIQMIKSGQVDENFDLNNEIELKQLEKREKKMNLKDYHARNLLGTIQENPTTTTLDTDDVDMSVFKAPDDEQDLFTVVEHQDDPASYTEFIEKELGPILKSDEPSEQFLNNFVLNRGWKFDSSDKIDYDEIVEDDEKFEQQEEEYEIKHNFRFEEPDSQYVIGHSRDIIQGVRRKDDKRKIARQLVKERKESEKLQKREELKRLKNLKRKEIERKLQEIKKNAGDEKLNFDLDLEEEFDPNKWDEKMGNVFNSEYYDRYEVKKDGKKPKKPKFKTEIPDMDDNKTTMEKERLQKYTDEYFQLDYEDLIQDLPVRFKYAQVESNDYSLKLEEILQAEDEQLNELISLKKLAPFRNPKVKERDEAKWKKVAKSKLWEFRAKLRREKTNDENIECNHDANNSQGKENAKREKELEKRRDTYKLTKKKTR